MHAWLFDLGNSRLKFAPCEDGGLGEVQAVPHDGRGFSDSWRDRLPLRLEVACVASVAAPELRDALVAELQVRGARVRLASTQAHCGGVRIAYAQPQALGVDRFLALLAAHARGGAWLVVGVGTALTVDLVDASGRHQGGRIAPSPALMREALQARVRQLPAEGGSYREFADGTLDGLVSGCLGAALGLVERSLREATATCGTVPGLLLHGGGAPALASHLPPAVVAPALVLEGLARWARLEAG
jgi:type III pantothenate kinase